MYLFKGKIFTITEKSDKASYIVIQTKQDGIKTLQAAEVYGFWKEKADALKLKKGDKIRGRLYIKSNFFKGRWYHNLNLKNIEVVKPKMSARKNELFKENEWGIIGDVKHIYDNKGNIIL